MAANQKGPKMEKLTPQQLAALSQLHKQLNDLAAQEGKGGPSMSAVIFQANAGLLELYMKLLNITPAK
jgi:hypothetical protein